MRALSSMTGVLMMPIGLMSPHGWPLWPGAVPTFAVQTVAPVVSSSANTSLLFVTAKKIPLPPGPPCR